MSGGVDSSAVAVMLKESGYEVIGVTITPFKIEDECRVKINERSCCDYQAVIDAAKLCDKLGIEHYLMDRTGAFKAYVIDYFIDEYMNGRTPNPCVVCNPTIKWGEMLAKAEALGAYYIATGHYAKLRRESGRITLSKGEDQHKDQSYFLWRLTQDQLERTLFPLSDMVKSQTRELLKERGIETADKLESQEICFVPENDYRSFLKKHSPELSTLPEGDIVYRGSVIGKHGGYPFYTVGQRRGLGVSHSEPLYVTRIDPEKNIIEVDVAERLGKKRLLAKKVNMIKYDDIPREREFIVKIRYKDSGKPALCKINSDGDLEVEFMEPRDSITPGQSVVVYEGNDVVAGAVIDSSSYE